MKIFPSLLDPKTLKNIEFAENEVIIRFIDGGKVIIRAPYDEDLIVATKEKDKSE